MELNTVQSAKTTKDRLICLLSSKRFLLGCLALAFVLHLGWILYADVEQRADAAWYYGRAQSILYGQGYVADTGKPTAYWPVGYPAFVAGMLYLGGSDTAVKLGNLVLYLGIVLLSYLLAREAFRSSAAAGLTALILAVYPTNILFGSLVLSEALYTFLSLLGIWMLLKARDKWVLAIPAGLIFGFATLTREVGWLVPLAAVFAMFFTERKAGRARKYLRIGLMVNAFMLLTIAPWSVRNYIVFHHFVPISTNKGVNLYLGNNPDANGGNMSDAAVYRFIPPPGTEVSEYQWEQICKRWAVHYIKAHPGRFLELIPLRLYRLFRADSSASIWNQDILLSHRLLTMLKWLCNAFYWTIMVLFVFALATYRSVRREHRIAGVLPAVMLLVVVCWILPCLPTHGEDRYHYPMMPIFIMFVAAMLTGFDGLRTNKHEDHTSAVAER